MIYPFPSRAFSGTINTAFPLVCCLTSICSDYITAAPNSQERSKAIPFNLSYALYKEGFFQPVQEFTGKKRILNMIEFAFLWPVAISASELPEQDLIFCARSKLL